MSDAELRDEWRRAVENTWGDELWKNLTPQRLREFISAGVNVNDRDCEKRPPKSYNFTPLHCIARYNDDAEVIKILIVEGALVNVTNWRGETPLHWAAGYNKNAQIVRGLIDEGGANVNARNNDCKTPLHFAASMSKNVEVIKEITSAYEDTKEHDIGEKANVKAKDIEGNTPYDCLLENDALKNNEEAIALLTSSS